MPIGISEEHEHLREAVRRFVDARITPSVVRAALDAPSEDRPPFWDALSEPGWLTLHVDGASLVEQAVVIEELGRAAAPGPYVPTAIAAALAPDAVRDGVVGAVSLDGVFAISGHLADVVVCEVAGTWYAVDAAAVAPREVASLDLTRRVARIEPAAG